MIITIIIIIIVVVIQSSVCPDTPYMINALTWYKTLKHVFWGVNLIIKQW